MPNRFTKTDVAMHLQSARDAEWRGKDADPAAVIAWTILREWHESMAARISDLITAEEEKDRDQSL